VNEALKDWLRKKASSKQSFECYDDWNPMDHSGGNFDDCYALGREDGMIQMARTILKIYFQEGGVVK